VSDSTLLPAHPLRSIRHHRRHSAWHDREASVAIESLATGGRVKKKT
jgi:hypothetical protein